MATGSINTVNVIEMAEGNFLRLTPFHDNPKGVELAESLFAQIAKENGAKSEDIESFIEDGYFSRDHGNYELFLIHSSS